MPLLERRRVKCLRHAVRKINCGCEKQRFALGGMLTICTDRMSGRVCRHQHIARFGVDKVTMARMECVEIGIEAHLHRPEVAEISGLHHGEDVLAIDDVGEDFSERLLVGPFGRRRESNRQGSVFGEAAEMIENLPIGIGRGVMRFVNDDGRESTCVDFRKPGLARKRLDRRYDDLTMQFIAFGLADSNAGSGVDREDLRGGLFYQLVTMRKDESALAALLKQMRKDYGFAGSGRQ
jgi:hypothetical protein